MAEKTYVPGAVDMANEANRYFTRWQAKLALSATTPEKMVALTNLIACFATFLQEWHKPPVQP
jgi:hypothetical protein